MNLKEFRRVGHTPTLAMAFLYFDVSFMIWVMLGVVTGLVGAVGGRAVVLEPVTESECA